MTDQTPATEAGRRLDAYLHKHMDGWPGYQPFTVDILAIEAEARADRCCVEMGCPHGFIMDGNAYVGTAYDKGRADALREAAVAVRRLPTFTRGTTVERAAVLALLQPDTASEYGRLLAERDRLIADGADPDDLEMPLPPEAERDRPR